MHEMSLAENVREIIEKEANAQGFRQVRTVWMEVGQLSCVEQDAMRFCFDAVMKGSIADGARLEIVEVPGQGTCMGCGGTSPISARYDACPRCGSYAMQVTSGDTMRVKELEVD